MRGGKWATEMGYFKVRAREQFVAPNEKADEITVRVKCNQGLVLRLKPEILLLLFFIISTLVQPERLGPEF